MHCVPSTCCAALFLCLAAAPSAAWPGEVVLRYFRGGMMPAGQQDVVEEFERRNPDIRVVAGITASRNMVSDPQRLLCAIVGGDPPDVVMFDRYAVAEWAARGAFRPLDEFIARDRGRPDGIRGEDFFAPTWQEAQWDGHVYAIPSGTDNRALYYNKDLLRAAGFVDADGEARPPRTWDELEDYAVRLSEFVRGPEGTVTRIRRVGFIPNYGNAWFYFYSWLNGGELLSADGRTCTLASAANVEAMRYVVRLYDSLGGARLVNAFQSTFQGAELDPFLTGRVAMKIDGNWVLSGIGTYRRDLNFGVAPAPLPPDRLAAGAPYISWSGGWSWVIPSGAKHPEQAWKLIRWLASEDAAIILSDANREANLAQGKIYIPHLSANKRITQTLYQRYLADDPAIDQKFRDAYQVFMNLLPQSKFRPVTPVG
ncbi:MAG: ABC transporter substrate-binding protein, partial [bacterium]